jgi:hypothetical protein
MKERARVEEQERQAEAEALLADLGHPASHAEKVLIEQASALVIEARKLRKAGKSSADAIRLLSRVLGQLGLGDAKRRPPEPQVDVASYLAEAAARHEAAEAAREDEA